MIVTCPSCSRRYVVQDEILGNGRLVRCIMCCTTWKQQPNIKEDKFRTLHPIGWGIYFSTIAIIIFALCFAKETVVEIWRPMHCFYKAIGVNIPTLGDGVEIDNVSVSAIKKVDDVYLMIKGDVINKSQNTQYIPELNIKLRTKRYGNSNEVSYEKSWKHLLNCRRLQPMQSISFETEPQLIPVDDLVCEVSFKKV